MRVLHVSSAFCLVLAVLNAGTNTASAATCSERVSTGDQSMGITAVEDATCMTGGLGCFPDGDQCRFCKEPNATQSSHLMLCSDVQVSMTTAGSGELTTKSTTTSSTMSDSLEAAVDCVSRVSVGDQGVGISAVASTTASCSANGLGCFESSKCRFCQSRATVQSAPYAKCSSFGGSSTSTGTTSTSSPTSSPTYTPAPTAASTSTGCSSVVSRSGLEGISYISESRCNVAAPSLLGCSARTSCRLCRNYKNEANQYLVSCQVLKDLGATESATASSTPTATDAAESVAINPSAADTVVESSGKLSVSTESENGAAQVATATTPVFAAAAVVALLVVVMMSVMYVKGRRNPMDECKTPDDGPGDDLLTPHGGRGYTPREGSLVMVVSQSSIATL
ncbi:hypothetical protein PRNP1_013421 [Phytophthora ramorum]